MTQARLYMAVALTALVALGCGLLTGPDGSEPLAIKRFLVTPERIDASGGKVTLLWSVEGAETVSIDHGIGEVEAAGTMQVTATATTVYTLTASGGNSTATSTVRVQVGKPTSSPAPSPSPGSSPSPSPSPSPSSSPSPSPSSRPSPSPSPSASPSPSPSPSAGPTYCGTPALPPDGCRLTIEQPAVANIGECAQLTTITAIPACPVGVGMTRTITFGVTAESPQPLTWRRAAGGQDAVTPASGSLLSKGKSSATITAVVYDSALGFEVVDASGRVLLRFNLQHR